MKQKNPDEVFCQSCGEVIKKHAVLCVHCGVVNKTSKSVIRANIHWFVSLVLCITLGIFGLHRFYTGKIKSAIVTLLLWLVMAGGGAIFVFVAGIKPQLFNINLYDLFENTIFSVYYSISAHNPPVFLFMGIITVIAFLFLIIWNFIDIILIAKGKYKIPSVKPASTKEKVYLSLRGYSPYQTRMTNTICRSCNSQLIATAELCMNCGVATQPSDSISFNQRWFITFLLTILLGHIGVHRFYNKKILQGFLTIGLFICLGVISFIYTKETKQIISLNRGFDSGALAILFNGIFIFIELWALIDAALLATSTYRLSGKAVLKMQV